MTRHFQEIRKDSAAPWPGPRGPEVRYRSDELEVIAYPEDGARITSLKAFGQEVLRQWSPERRGFQYGCFPMVPWVGRVGGGLLYHDGAVHQLEVNRPPHALHGLACFKPWIVDSDGSFVLDLADVWPWPGTARQRISVEDAALTIGLEVSTAGEPFPAAAGWHPWFSRWLSESNPVPESEAQLRFDAEWQEEAAANQLPTGRRIEPLPGPWDNCFGNDHPATADIQWPGLRMDMTSSTGWLTAFTEPPDAFCVEPLTGPPNGVNTAPQVVRKGAPLRIETIWTFTQLP